MARKGGAPENLKPFKKGKSGNPKGRPKILPELKEALEKILLEEKNGVIALETVLQALRLKAVKGDVRAIQELLDRYYGKVKQDVGIEGGVILHFDKQDEKL